MSTPDEKVSWSYVIRALVPQKLPEDVTPEELMAAATEAVFPDGLTYDEACFVIENRFEFLPEAAMGEEA